MTIAYDVVAVNISSKRTRLLEQNIDLRTAEAAIRYTVMRRGVDTEYYVEVPSGQYKDGDVWKGQQP